MPKQLISYTDFRGGWNVDVAPDKLADNEMEIADNVDLDERGPAKKSKGTAPLNATSYGAQVERIIEWPRKDGTKVLLAVVGTTLCKIAEDGTKTNIQALTSVDIGYFFLQDKFYFSDGTEYRVYDGTTCSAVTPGAEADNNLAPIKRCKYMVWNPKSFRIFYAGDSLDRAALYYSEPNRPDYVKSTSKVYPTTGDGPVNGLSLFGDSLLTFYQNTVWSWQGVDPAIDATWSKLPLGQGTIANRAIGLTPNSLTFPGIGGLYALNPGVLDYNVIMVTGNELVKNIAKDKVTKVIRSAVHTDTMCAVYDKYNERYLLAYGDDPLNARNNKVLVLDWGLQAFTRYTEWQVNDFCQRADGTLLIATNGYILKTGQGSNNFDVTAGAYASIPYKVSTKQFNLDYPFHIKKVKKTFVAAKQVEAETSSINITVTDNYEEIIFSDVSLDDSFSWGEIWGNQWGYSDYTDKELKTKLKGKRVQVIFENNKLDEPVTIYGLAFLFKVSKPKGVKV